MIRLQSLLSLINAKVYITATFYKFVTKTKEVGFVGVTEFLPLTYFILPLTYFVKFEMIMNKIVSA